MSTRKYLRLADGYHERSPYNQSSKYSNKQSNNTSESRSERSSNINGGSRSRNNSPRSRQSNMSPRTQRTSSSYSKTKELSRRGTSASPIERNVSSHSTSNAVLKVDSISTDDSFPWSQHTSSSGKTYYYNCKTEKSQWEKPKEWIEREHQLEREKKKHENKDRSDQTRDNSHPNVYKERLSSRDSNQELSNKRDSQGHAVIGNKYDREKITHSRDENKRQSQQHAQDNKRMPQQDSKRIPQQHGSDNKRLAQHAPDGKRLHHNQANNQTSSNSVVVKTTSANTNAVSTTVHRPDQVFAKAETKVSPSGSLQNVSPTVTPVITVSQSTSPAVATCSPIMVTYRSPANIQTHSPVQQNAQRLLPMSQRTSTNTPPPPPPPIFPQVSPAHNIVTSQARHTETSPKNVVRSNVEGLLKQQENTMFNGLHGQLHPLQQATLLQQAQFQGSAVVRPLASPQGVVSSRSPGPSSFQPIKQSNSTPGSPQPFHPRPYQSMAPAVQRTTVTSLKQPILHPPAQSVNLQDYVNYFNRDLTTHIFGWPADTVEKQAQRSSDDTTNLCLMNSRLKTDLIPLNFHQSLTRMRMGVGTKRIKFLREQTRKLESSDAIS
ncbi:WW domain-containing adapter protein with coiled-coil-like [Dendronephthya gigantea]|uniref:WW domain-containing adapter protein with coiled-coil-like n=1 Tax=Dendronephthya gigantea TaxID=151771 RepID=UPI00106D8E28|nr:WW domain-containing adapter protein with coiled-coil-like [Dendronephthya gigantea]